MSENLALEGLKVLDLTRLLPGGSGIQPHCPTVSPFRLLQCSGNPHYTTCRQLCQPILKGDWAEA